MLVSRKHNVYVPYKMIPVVSVYKVKIMGVVRE